MRRHTVLALVPAAVLLAGCGSSSTTSSSPGASAAASRTPSSAASAEVPATTQASTDAPGTRVITLDVSGGKTTGDTGRVVVKLGTPVDVAVTADVAQEVHIHGYDLHLDTVPGSTVHERFVADIPGVFTVELEQTSTTLTRLQVQ